MVTNLISEKVASFFTSQSCCTQISMQTFIFIDIMPSPSPCLVCLYSQPWFCTTISTRKLQSETNCCGFSLCELWKKKTYCI